MNRKRLMRIIVCLSIVAIFAAASCAQRPVKSQGKESAAPEGPKTTVKGKISYTRSGYFLEGEEPPGRFIIANENTQVLGELAKRGNVVTVEGRLTIGADYLFIEKIDGKRYQGAKEPASK